MNTNAWTSLSDLSEDELRRNILIPLLEKTPRVEQISDVHGVNERGLDVVFSEVSDVKKIWYGLQIKTGDIRGGGSQSQTVKQIIDQLELATDLDHPIAIDPAGRVSIDQCIVVTNGSISGTARQEIADRIDPVPVSFWDSHELMSRIQKYDPALASGTDVETLEYLRSVQSEAARLDALDQVSGVAERALPEVFVEPTIQRKFDPAIAEGEDVAVLSSPTQALDIVEEAHRSVLIGDQNAGKSCVLRMLAIRMIERILDPDVDEDGEAWIPVMVHGRAIVEKNSVQEAVESELETHGALARSDDVDGGLKSGDYCILIDGFSELLAEDDKGRCEDLVASFVDDYSDVPVVIAARPEDCLDPGPFRSFVHWTIKRFDEDQVKSLVRQWTDGDYKFPDVAKKMVGRIRDALQLPGSPIPAVIGVMLHEKQNRFITNTAEAVDKYMVIRLGRYAKEMGIQQEVDWNRKEDLLAEIAFEMVENEVEVIERDALVERFNKVFERWGEREKGRIAVEELIDAGVLDVGEHGVRFHRTAFRDFFAAKNVYNRCDDFEGFFRAKFFERKWGQVLVFAAGLSRHNSDLLMLLHEKVDEAGRGEESDDDRFAYGAYLLGRILSNSDPSDAGPRRKALRTCLKGTSSAISGFEEEAVEQFGNIGRLAALIGIEQTFFVTVGVPWLEQQFGELIRDDEISDEERYLLLSAYCNLGCEGWLELMEETVKDLTSTRALVAGQILFSQLADERSLKESSREDYLSLKHTLNRRLRKRSDAVGKLLELKNKFLEIERKRVKRLEDGS